MGENGGRKIRARDHATRRAGSKTFRPAYAQHHMQKEDTQMQAVIGDIGMARTQPRLEIATPYQMIITAHTQVARSDSIERTFKEVWREKSVDEDWSGKGVVVGL